MLKTKILILESLRSVIRRIINFISVGVDRKRLINQLNK